MNIQAFFERQLAEWPMCRANFEALKGVKVKTFLINGCEVRVQFNPARIRSTGAKVDKAALAKRPCFLCEENRPKEQKTLPNPPSKGGSTNSYHILVNPYPIFPVHLTIPAVEHTPQSIQGRLMDMLLLAREMPKLLVFYNGAQSGASAPDHMHFQAGTREDLPLLRWEHYPTGDPICKVSGQHPEDVARQAQLLIRNEELLNLVATYDTNASAPQYTLYILNRKAFRPWQYTAEGEKQLLVSPATVEMGGVFICPVEEHFERITEADILDILQQCYLPAEPQIAVGILGAQPIQRVDNLDGTTTLKQVKIGIGFHWERREDQTFRGEIREENGVAVNHLSVEDYLESVISSEMAATSDLELLKAHAVISRSWALNSLSPAPSPIGRGAIRTRKHKGFDVCADDCCQRYQGVTRMLESGANATVRQAIEETRGEVLTYEGTLCDTRYSKCCGGRTEVFSTCWEDVDLPYLQSVECRYCNTQDAHVLSQVLNNYDQETRDFHDWTEVVKGSKLKVKGDIGTIVDLIPLERGVSGRIKRLKVVGEKGSVEIGKELAIRKLLSESCLKSSWFDVRKDGEDFVLTGHGWGHGVGLCQIGAAVMAHEGKNYKEILAHYYKGARIMKWY